MLCELAKLIYTGIELGLFIDSEGLAARSINLMLISQEAVFVIQLTQLECIMRCFGLR